MSDAKPDTGTDRQGQRCPMCSAPCRADYRPFCSKRCADRDLNRWLSGVYAVPCRPAEEEGDEALGRDDSAN